MIFQNGNPRPKESKLRGVTLGFHRSYGRKERGGRGQESKGRSFLGQERGVFILKGPMEIQHN